MITIMIRNITRREEGEEAGKEGEETWRNQRGEADKKEQEREDSLEKRR